MKSRLDTFRRLTKKQQLVSRQLSPSPTGLLPSPGHRTCESSHDSEGTTVLIIEGSGLSHIRTVPIGCTTKDELLSELGIGFPLLYLQGIEVEPERLLNSTSAQLDKSQIIARPSSLGLSPSSSPPTTAPISASPHPPSRLLRSGCFLHTIIYLASHLHRYDSFHIPTYPSYHLLPLSRIIHWLRPSTFPHNMTSGTIILHPRFLLQSLFSIHTLSAGNQSETDVHEYCFGSALLPPDFLHRLLASSVIPFPSLSIPLHSLPIDQLSATSRPMLPSTPPSLSLSPSQQPTLTLSSLLLSPIYLVRLNMIYSIISRSICALMAPVPVSGIPSPLYNITNATNAPSSSASTTISAPETLLPRANPLAEIFNRLQTVSTSTSTTSTSFPSPTTRSVPWFSTFLHSLCTKLLQLTGGSPLSPSLPASSINTNTSPHPSSSQTVKPSSFLSLALECIQANIPPPPSLPPQCDPNPSLSLPKPIQSMHSFLSLLEFYLPYLTTAIAQVSATVDSQRDSLDARLPLNQGFETTSRLQHFSVVLLCRTVRDALIRLYSLVQVVLHIPKRSIDSMKTTMINPSPDPSAAPNVPSSAPSLTTSGLHTILVPHHETLSGVGTVLDIYNANAKHSFDLVHSEGTPHAPLTKHYELESTHIPPFLPSFGKKVATSTTSQPSTLNWSALHHTHPPNLSPNSSVLDILSYLPDALLETVREYVNDTGPFVTFSATTPTQGVTGDVKGTDIGLCTTDNNNASTGCDMSKSSPTGSLGSDIAILSITSTDPSLPITDVFVRKLHSSPLATCSPQSLAPIISAAADVDESPSLHFELPITIRYSPWVAMPDMKIKSSMASDLFCTQTHSPGNQPILQVDTCIYAISTLLTTASPTSVATLIRLFEMLVHTSNLFTKSLFKVSSSKIREAYSLGTISLDSLTNNTLINSPDSRIATVTSNILTYCNALEDLPCLLLPSDIYQPAITFPSCSTSLANSVTAPSRESPTTSSPTSAWHSPSSDLMLWQRLNIKSLLPDLNNSPGFTSLAVAHHATESKIELSTRAHPSGQSTSSNHSYPPFSLRNIVGKALTLQYSDPLLVASLLLVPYAPSWPRDADSSVETVDLKAKQLPPQRNQLLNHVRGVIDGVKRAYKHGKVQLLNMSHVTGGLDRRSTTITETPVTRMYRASTSSLSETITRRLSSHVTNSQQAAYTQHIPVNLDIKDAIDVIEALGDTVERIAEVDPETMREILEAGIAMTKNKDGDKGVGPIDDRFILQRQHQSSLTTKRLHNAASVLRWVALTTD